MKIIYDKNCPLGKRYQMLSNSWKMNGKLVLPKAIRDKHKQVEVRHPSDKTNN